MLRRIIFPGIAAGAIAALGFWAGEKTAVVAQDAHPSLDQKSTGPLAPRAAHETSNADRRLAQVSATAPLPGLRTGERRLTTADPIIIPGGQLRLIYQEDVPSQRDGVLMFIGTEVHDDEAVPGRDIIEVKMGDKIRKFLRLKEGDHIQHDQLVALVDDTLARADEAIKEAKVSSAKAEKEASEKTRDEAKSRYDTQVKLYYSSNVGGLHATSKEDLTGALLTWTKYKFETISKEEAIKVAAQELTQAQKTLAMYEIRPKFDGVVKTILKHPGEAVKSLEPILQIQNYERLRVDAYLPVQYANHLQKGMEVVIEPTIRESPKQTLIGHRGTINSVAVCPDPRRPLIVSGSDDRTVSIWEPSPGNGRMWQTHVLRLPAPVKAVACSASQCLVGDDQGKGRLFDLAHLDGKPLELQGQHDRAIIECAAFNPDGRLCATGGSDNQIMIWDTATGILRYRLSGNNFITALHFTPDGRLVSVGRDAVRFWQLGADHAEPLSDLTISRRNPFDNLDVSPDGQRMMDEEGGEIRIISLRDGTTEAVLRNSNLSLRRKFVNFALFSPDGQLALTTPEEGKLVQLWRIDKVHSSELRQYIPSVPPSTAPRSAAFAPDGSYVVAAVNDRIEIWPVPGKQEINQRFIGTITNVDKPIEDVSNGVRITAELQNPDQRLRPGDVVTMVAYPQ